MLNIKKLRNGKIALIFEEGSEKTAYQLAQVALQGLLEGKTLGKQEESLKDVRTRIESGKKSRELGKPVFEIAEPLPKGLTKESEGDVISRIIFEKIWSTYQSKAPVYFTTFYKALERSSGYDLSEIHRERTEGKDTRLFPNRKIDSVLSVLDTQYVMEFVRNYSFPTKKAV